MSSWKTLLLRIGDLSPEYAASSDYKEHIETCSGVLRRECEHSKDDILELILQCAEQIPHKIPFYGVLVGLINLEDEGFVKTIVNDTQSRLQDALLSGNCNKIRIFLRFVSVLMCCKVLLSGSIVEAFEVLLSSAATTIDEEMGNPSWQPRGDFYVSCILSSLPWCGLELIEQAPDDLDRIMVGIQSYLSIRRHASDIGSAAFILDEDKCLKEKDFLEDLWDRIQVLSSSGWKADSVPRPHLSFEAQLVDGKSHEFPPISSPGQPQRPSSHSTISYAYMRHEAYLSYPRRLRRLNIFPASKVENIQPIDRFIVEEYLLDVLFFFNGCRKECAFYMAGLPVPFRYEYLMAETIFSQLLLLPQPPFRLLYYTLVIIDLCKALPAAFPTVVAGAVRSLFNKIDDLDMECRMRLILWFSHHLSNFQFIWHWEEWALVIDLPKWAPQRVFVQEVLEREVRLSYWDKINQSIEDAPTLKELLPPKGVSDFKFGTEDGNQSDGHMLSTELSSLVKGRKTANEIISWVENTIVPVHGSDFAIEVVIQTLLDIGSKSFTHLTIVLQRYGQVISKLCLDFEKQFLLIKEVSSYWKNNPQMTAITIDRMMSYRLVSNLSIVEWVFSPAIVDQFHLTDHPWEILRNTITKTNNRISDMRKEISSLEKDILLAECEALKAKTELEVAEAKLEIVDGEPVLVVKPDRLEKLKARADKSKDEETSFRESLEAKEALLSRASKENKELYVVIYKKFAEVLLQRLPEGFTCGKLHREDMNAMPVDSDGPASMETDQDTDKSLKVNHGSGEEATKPYNIGEQEQWGRTTLGYVIAFTRQYATEIWCHVERIEAEIFAKDVHPLFQKAVYVGLGRTNDL